MPSRRLGARTLVTGLAAVVLVNAASLAEPTIPKENSPPNSGPAIWVHDQIGQLTRFDLTSGTWKDLGEWRGRITSGFTVSPDGCRIYGIKRPSPTLIRYDWISDSGEWQQARARPITSSESDPLRELHPHHQPIVPPFVTPDGKYLFVVIRKGRTLVIDGHTLEPVGAIDKALCGVSERGVAFSDDARRLYAVTWDKMVVEVSLENVELSHAVSIPPEYGSGQDLVLPSGSDRAYVLTADSAARSGTLLSYDILSRKLRKEADVVADRFLYTTSLRCLFLNECRWVEHSYTEGVGPAYGLVSERRVKVFDIDERDLVAEVPWPDLVRLWGAKVEGNELVVKVAEDPSREERFTKTDYRGTVFELIDKDDLHKLGSCKIIGVFPDRSLAAYLLDLPFTSSLLVITSYPEQQVLHRIPVGIGGFRHYFRRGKESTHSSVED